MKIRSRDELKDESNCIVEVSGPYLVSIVITSMKKSCAVVEVQRRRKEKRPLYVMNILLSPGANKMNKTVKMATKITYTKR